MCCSRPSPASSQETAYTALSRGRYSNHIFAIIRRLAEPSRQPDAEWGSEVRARLLAAHQTSRAASPAATSVTPSGRAGLPVQAGSA
jgi:hypothetical protein